MGIERLKSTGSGGIMRSESEVKVKVAQLCLTLCDPMDYTVHGILQARVLEWVAFPFSGDLPDPGIINWSCKLTLFSER